MTTVPKPVLAALDLLNSHAGAFGCGKKAIYKYKTVAALVMAHAGELTARPVKVEAKCHSCDGTGLWRDWYSYKNEPVVNHSPCRKCRRTGKVMLRFVETRFGDRCWHHPAVGNGWDILRTAWRIVGSRYPHDGPGIWILADGREITIPEDELITDWEPGRRGKRLDIEEAVSLLNIVESWLTESKNHLDAGDSRWPVERALQEMRRYQLDIGRTDDTCCVCGVGIDHAYDNNGDYPRSLGFIRYRLHWEERTCLSCRDAKHPEKAPPPELLTPEITAWLARRRIDLTVPWKPEPYRGEEW